MQTPAQRFADLGCLSIQRLFAPPLIDALHAEYMRQYGDLEVNRAPGNLRVGERRLQLPIKLSGPFLDSAFYANSFLLHVLTELLGADMLIDSIACVSALPGARAQNLHVDHSDLFPGDPALRALHGAFAVTVAIPLIDLNEETGTTRLYPGSHVEPRGEHFDEPYAARGDCYLMDYRLWHHGTANRSDAPRPILYIVYARPWFTDISNFQIQQRINIDPDDVARIAPAHRTLFRRLAAKGALDRSQAELLGESGAGGQYNKKG